MKRTRLEGTRSQLAGMSFALALAWSSPATAVVPNDALSYDDILDDTGVNGIGLVRRGDRFLCTGTLINPRTVLFAAHCVNDNPADQYGLGLNDTPIAFMTAADALADSERWFESGFRSDQERGTYNADSVIYHPDSLSEGEFTWLADIALLSLAGPASEVPTWALLLSPLPAPAEISAEQGTGYHASLSGYGDTGSGTDGAYAFDFRRRVAENWLGSLASLAVTDSFIGNDIGQYGQYLYQTDFDDPLRENPYDQNVFRDEALPAEGDTAVGDSGGPLILDTMFTRPVLLGVLMGGDRADTAAPWSSYGGTSYYQPLYLYWDWLAEQSRYRYVGTLAGDGRWEDPMHWLSRLDPSYFILDDDGNPISGIPDRPGAGAYGVDEATPFGQVCDASGGCYDLATGIYTENGIEMPSPFDPALFEQVGEPVPDTLPAATLANGLPGASGFVPDNSFAAGSGGYYFDVQLAAPGTTTLDSQVTIDRLTLEHPEAALHVRSQGALTSLIDISQHAGQLQVDGELNTPGDLVNLAGLINGSGLIRTPYLTNISGVLTPGGLAASGVLTLEGNLIQASAGTLLIELGADGVSDRLDVRSEEAGAGIADLGGRLQLLPITSSSLAYGNQYRILTATGGVQGRFVTPEPWSALLYPELLYGSNTLDLRVEAGRYQDVADMSDPAQQAYARLLDVNRSQYSAYSDLYAPLDRMNADDVRASLASLRPGSEQLRRSLSRMAVEQLTAIMRSRLLVSDTSRARPGGKSVRAETREGARTTFITLDALNGHSRAMPGSRHPDDDVDGWYLATGQEQRTDGGSLYGAVLAYLELNGAGAGGHAEVGLSQASLYGQTRLTSVLQLDALAGLGYLRSQSGRSYTLSDQSFRLAASDQAWSMTAELGLSLPFHYGTWHWQPRLALQAVRIDQGVLQESGAGGALRFRLQDHVSVQGRLGVNLSRDQGRFRPYLNLHQVHEFRELPDGIWASFPGGVGKGARFDYAPVDQNWSELGGGLKVPLNNIDLLLKAEFSLGRSDLEQQAFGMEIRGVF